MDKKIGKIKRIFRYNFFVLVIVLLCMSLIGIRITKPELFNIFAEQIGLSPESGVDSRLKEAYDILVAKGTNYGGVESSIWTNDWGTRWNRIMHSATWEPQGSATPSDVSSGKTFYSGDTRTTKTGTNSLDYSLQQYDNYDDGHASDYTGEESSWTNTATNVWQDNRTGLYWSASQGQMSNIFPNTDHSTCDFFSTTPRGNYAGGDADCGNAINTCGTLSLEAVTGQGAKTDWYLPTLKELTQAHINGMYNQAGDPFTTTYAFWASTEYSYDPTRAWRVFIRTSSSGGTTKSTATGYYVRCVRRD